MPFKKMISATALCLCSGLLFAEPALQAGDTLESLSKVRISTTIQTPVSAEETALIAELDQAEIEGVDTNVTPAQNPVVPAVAAQVTDEQIIAELDAPELS